MQSLKKIHAWAQMQVPLWCVGCSHKWGVQRHIFFGPAPWGLWEGPKGQISLNIIKFQLQSQFERFFNQTLCVTHERYKTYQTGFSFGGLGHALGVGLGGTVGGWGVKKIFFRNSTRFDV